MLPFCASVLQFFIFKCELCHACVPCKSNFRLHNMNHPHNSNSSNLHCTVILCIFFLPIFVLIMSCEFFHHVISPDSFYPTYTSASHMFFSIFIPHANFCKIHNITICYFCKLLLHSVVQFLQNEVNVFMSHNKHWSPSFIIFNSLHLVLFDIIIDTVGLRLSCDTAGHVKGCKMVSSSFRSLEVYSLHQKKVYTCGKAKYSKSRGARGKVGDAPHPPLSWSKLDQASFWNSKRWRHKNKKSEATSLEKYRKIQRFPLTSMQLA